MPEKVVQGRSLEAIRQEWAEKLKLLPEDIDLQVVEKPGLFSRRWTVRVIWAEADSADSKLTPGQAHWDGVKYVLTLGEGVKRLIPSAKVGELWVNGSLQKKEFSPNPEDHLEFQPKSKLGCLTWELKVLFQGLSAVAKVSHELAGHYILSSALPAGEEINLELCVEWEATLPEGDIWNEAKLHADLEGLKIVYGVKEGIWQEFLAVNGSKEIVVAEATLPVPCQNAQLEDFISNPHVLDIADDKPVDFFASKVLLVQEGAVLARKIPGKPGVPGTNIFGQTIPTTAFKDFQFRLKENVKLSEDGLEVLALCSGQPERTAQYTYAVKSVYVLKKDVDLTTGSIEFPGDVLIDGNVQDGFRVLAGGKIEIMGSVTHAEIRAEKGSEVHKNFIGGKAVIGEKFVVRFQLFRSLSELHDQLYQCLLHTKAVIKAAGKGGNKCNSSRILKLILEKKFPELPKLSVKTEKCVLEHKTDEIVIEGLTTVVQTARHFLEGLGPLEPQSLAYLQRVERVLEKFIQQISPEIAEELFFKVGYVQGAVIQCAGTFECQKGIYNSEIRTEGDLKIDGVCRGGRISAGGKVYIHELGGSEVSSTFVQIDTDGHLNVDYCHPNVIVAVGKEMVHIEEACRSLEIYRENGRVNVEKIRANPL